MRSWKAPIAIKCHVLAILNWSIQTMFYRHWPCWSSSEIMFRYRGVIKSMDRLKTSDQTLTSQLSRSPTPPKKWPFLDIKVFVPGYVYVHFKRLSYLSWSAFSFWHLWSRGTWANQGLGWGLAHTISNSSHFTIANGMVTFTHSHNNHFDNIDASFESSFTFQPEKKIKHFGNVNSSLYSWFSMI